MMRRHRTQGGSRGGWPAAVLALLLLQVLLLLPARPDAALLPALLRLPLELPLLLLLLWLAPPRWRRPLRACLVLLLALLLLVKLCDLVTYTAFARPMNLLLDLHLAAAGWQWLEGALGAVLAVAVLAAVGLVYLGLVAVAAWALARLERAAPHRGWAAATAGGLLLLAGGLYYGAGERAWLAAEGAGILRYQVTSLSATLADVERFREEVAEDPFAAVPDEVLLANLRGRDVLIVFIESYGRGALENPLYDDLQDSLRGLQEELRQAGFEARSAWATSSTLGGQSWLAHETFLSGLWIDNQRRHASLLTSRRATLIGDFRRAGWRAVGVMPALTKAWPEGAFFGFDRVYQAADLGYAGAPFNWITMPDQYTLAALQRLELAPADRAPVLAFATLISSHAPWTPIPPLLPWGEVGDGSVFTPYATAGDPPEVVWQSGTRIRAQYGLSLDYVLRTLVSFVLTYGREDLVVLLIGDHQPPPWVSGDESSRDVPVHVITRGATLDAAFDGWGWTPGLLPAAEAPVWRMDRFRDQLLGTFTPAAAPDAGQS